MLAMRISNNDPMVMFSSNIGNVLWVCLILTLAVPPLIERRRKRAAAASGATAG